MALGLAENKILSRVVIEGLSPHRFMGNVALVSHGGYTKEMENRFAFKDWKIAGSKLEHFPDRNLGPIVTALYTLSRGTLKLTVQFMPLSKLICTSKALRLGSLQPHQHFFIPPIQPLSV